MQHRVLVEPTRLLTGIGLHSGRHSRLTLLPAPPSSGIRFLREDLGPEAWVPASLEAARPSPRRTILEAPIAAVDGRRTTARVSTAEHLLAALFGLGIFDAVALLDGDEVPILDGSAAPFVEALLCASRPLPATSHEDPRPRVVRPFLLAFGGSRCRLHTSPTLRVECLVDFAHPSLGRSLVRFDESDVPLRFAERFARARTFGFQCEAASLRRNGLARGGSLGSVLVFDGKRVVNPSGSRFSDEPARHKLLDTLGDLSLLGGPLRGAVRLERASHALLIQTLVRAVAEGAITTIDRAVEGARNIPCQLSPRSDASGGTSNDPGDPP